MAGQPDSATRDADTSASLLNPHPNVIEVGATRLLVTLIAEEDHPFATFRKRCGNHRRRLKIIVDKEGILL